MFGKKELQRELEQKEQQIQELNRRIKEYQDKNDAVVSALTDAKSAANRIIGAAEAKRDDIIAAAMREKAGMEAQRDGILDEARAQAAAIVADARRGQRPPRSRPGTSGIISETPQIRCAAKPKTTPASLKITSISASASSRRRKRQILRKSTGTPRSS